MNRIKRLIIDIQDESGQSYVLLAMAFVVLLGFSGLVVDAGWIFLAKMQLSRAVDAAALAAAPEASQDGSITSDVDDRVSQFLGVNETILAAPITYTLSVPAADQLRVEANGNVPTHFIRIIGILTGIDAFMRVSVSASATAQYSANAEIPIKPTGGFGSESAVNCSVWGPMSKKGYGDAYSPIFDGGPGAGPAYPGRNADYGKLPDGYVFRISVPANYASANGTSRLRVEIFDPDNYNAPVGASPDGGVRRDTNVNRGVSPALYFRVDEIRERVDNGSDQNDVTRYTLWHLDPSATSILSPHPSQVNTIATYVADGTSVRAPLTDLKWVCPDSTNSATPNRPDLSVDGNQLITSGSFEVDINSFAAMPDGSHNFYLSVKTLSGSSENNFDIRSGPPQTVQDEIDPLTHRQRAVPWNSGGSYVYAVRAMCINFNTSSMETRYLTFIPPDAAGQKIVVRHFDTDNGTHNAITYYLKDISTSVWSSQGFLASGDEWYGNNSALKGDLLTLPPEGSPVWMDDGQPVGRWLALDYQGGGQDTSVWEIYYPRSRLLQ